MPRTRRPILIYGMLDPRDGQIHYVGLTTLTLEGRRGWHLKDTRPCNRVKWIKDLLCQGLSPIMIQLDQSRTSREAAEKEIWWISKGRELGWPLTNCSEGGEEPPRYVNRRTKRNHVPRK